jgi:micrococcal nuclease
MKTLFVVFFSMLLTFTRPATAIEVRPKIGTTYSCVVHKVWDGDTFDSLCKTIGESRIRLYQADAPERSQPRGGDSLGWLNTRLFKKTVRVRVVSVEPAIGNHQQRLVGWVTLDRISINRDIVITGWAWAAPGFTKAGDSIRRAETTARKKQVGVWQDLNPISPWDWRHGRRH